MQIRLSSLAAAATLFLFLTACASINPQTTQEKIYVGVDQAIAMYHTADRLHDTGVLSDSQYSDVLDNLQEANDALTDARSLYNAGQALEAEDRVQLANTLLLSVRSELEERQDE